LETSDQKITKNIFSQRNESGATFLHRFYAMNWERLWGSGISLEIVNNLKVLQRNFVKEDFENFLAIRDNHGKTFIFYTLDSYLFEATMKFLAENMSNKYVDKFLSLTDHEGNSILTTMYKSFTDFSTAGFCITPNQRTCVLI
jgi:hypothetical protein